MRSDQILGSFSLLMHESGIRIYKDEIENEENQQNKKPWRRRWTLTSLSTSLQPFRACRSAGSALVEMLKWYQYLSWMLVLVSAVCSISLPFQLHSAITILRPHPLAFSSLSAVIASRGRDIKKQHEQRVYERKMQRINLPLSAFSNPSCELVDENTIVITAEHEMTPVQEDRDGGDPLIGQQSGTPGAWVRTVL